MDRLTKIVLRVVELDNEFSMLFRSRTAIVLAFMVDWKHAVPLRAPDGGVLFDGVNEVEFHWKHPWAGMWYEVIEMSLRDFIYCGPLHGYKAGSSVSDPRGVAYRNRLKLSDEAFEWIKEPYQSEMFGVSTEWFHEQFLHYAEPMLDLDVAYNSTRANSVRLYWVKNKAAQLWQREAYARAEHYDLLAEYKERTGQTLGGKYLRDLIGDKRIRATGHFDTQKVIYEEALYHSVQKRERARRAKSNGGARVSIVSGARPAAKRAARGDHQTVHQDSLSRAERPPVGNLSGDRQADRA